MIVRSSCILALLGVFLVVKAAPHGGHGGEEEFRDTKYDEKLKQVSKVGNTYVAALEIYDNPPDQDNAQKEVDNFPSNVYTKYDDLQHKVKSFFDAEPIIDNIRESDKYGNTGDQFYFITKPLVETTAKVNMFINSVIAAPKKLLSGFQKQANDKLNDVGAKLVGVLVICILALVKQLQCLPLPGHDAADAEAKIQADRELLNTVTYVGNNKVYGLLSNEQPTMRVAKLEKEDFDSSILTKLENVQKKFVDKGNIPALVDQTHPSDYYGNDVKLAPLQRGIVGIVEQLSNVFNAIVEKVPKGAVVNLNKSVLNRLNQIGAVLVGLEDAKK
uniref:Uncharacterized protein n=1 Tax=Anopheles dirus TaxID=7168 RepID=A0A182NI29_9DIPT